MKRILLLIILLVTAATTGFADDRVFQKFPSGLKISTVYISPAALKLGLSVDSQLMGSFKKLLKKPQSIEILSTENKDAFFSLEEEECHRVVKKLRLELILNCADVDTKTNIYIGKILSDSEIENILIETKDLGSYTMVFIRGIIDSKELMNLYNSEASKSSANDSTATTSSGRKRKTPRSKKTTSTIVPITVERVDSFGCEY